MISDKTAMAINNQINAEMYSAYLYLGMSGYCAEAGLKGGANWFYVQAKEEMVHAEKLYNYVQAQGQRVELLTIDAPPSDFKSVLDCFERALEHEKKVTALINDLVALAVEQKDRATEIYLDWFVAEQVEEEESAKDVVDRLTLAGAQGPGLFMVDTELAARVFTPPATANA